MPEWDDWVEEKEVADKGDELPKTKEKNRKVPEYDQFDTESEERASEEDITEGGEDSDDASGEDSDEDTEDTEDEGNGDDEFDTTKHRRFNSIWLLLPAFFIFGYLIFGQSLFSRTSFGPSLPLQLFYNAPESAVAVSAPVQEVCVDPGNITIYVGVAQDSKGCLIGVAMNNYAEPRKRNMKGTAMDASLACH